MARAQLEHKHTPDRFIGWHLDEVAIWNCHCGNTIIGPEPTEEEAEQEIEHVEAIIVRSTARGDVLDVAKRRQRLEVLLAKRAARLAR